VTGRRKADGNARHMSMAAKVGVVVLLVALVGSFAFMSRLHTQGGSNVLVVTLVNINLILVVLLSLLLSRNLVKWVFDEGHLSSLRTRLVAAFVGFSLVPTVLLFVVASGLLTDSVNGWFSPQMEGAMKGAMQVARERYREMHQQVAKDTSIIAAVWSREGAPKDAKWVDERLTTTQKTWNLSGIALRYGDDLATVRVAGNVGVARAIADGGYSETFAVPEGELVRAGVPVGTWGYLVAERLIPQVEIDALRRITEDYENFSQLAAYKEPIKKGYRLSFLVIALVILFSASWFGFYIARGITTPLQRLVEGTRDVAGGDLSVQLKRTSKDEVGELVDSFNTMIAQLARGKDEITHANRSLTLSNQELEQRRAYMEAILENADTGVIAMDPAGLVTLFNRAAARMLAMAPEQVKGRLAADAFADSALAPLATLIGQVQAVGVAREQEMTLAEQVQPVTLQVHARPVSGPEGDDLGLVLVFSDMTQLIRGQKEAAWREVAQRLAHEIKNPLTPIQLSVQRLRRQYTRDGNPLPAVVEETAAIILEEVAGLKRLVDEFSQFARMPEVNLEPNDIWGIVNEVAGLYRQAYPELSVVIEEVADAQLSLDKKQMRRVFTNLFENAVQVMGGTGVITVTGNLMSEDCLEISVADNGPGIPPGEENEVFRPYYSRREGGTGLGLAIVSRIIEEHEGRIRVLPSSPSGATFILSLPIG